MSPVPPSTSDARPPFSAEAWVIAPEIHLGLRGRLGEIWRYRRILLFFSLKAVQMLYRNTKLGPVWLLIRPLVPVVAGGAVFGGLMDVASDGVPYFLFFLAGSVIWGFFAESLPRASRSLEINRGLLTKLYLPRLLLPACYLCAGMVEPLVLLVVLIGALVYYGTHHGLWYHPTAEGFFVAVLAVVLAVALAFGVSLITSVLQARARDVRYLLGYVLGFWMFLTPVIYPLSKIPARVRWLATLNPMTGPVEAFKWGVLGIGEPPWGHLATAGVLVTVVVSFGVWYFGRVEAQTLDRM